MPSINAAPHTGTGMAEKSEIAEFERTYSQEDGSEREKLPLDADPEFSPAEGRKIIHKIDRRLVYILGIMYCVSLIDRANLPNAAIAGMTVELELTVGFRYSIIALVFFVTYVLFQPPTTILCRALGPRPFLSGLCIAWGAVMIGFGFVQSWVTLIPLRLLLGVFEAGYKRFALFFLLGLMASGMAGILAYGLQQMNGLGGLGGWRWIFIMEGILTVAIGFVGYVFVVDFPDKVKQKKHWGFLTDREIDFIIRRIDNDRGDVIAEPWSWKKWASSGLDWKIWTYAVCFFCVTGIGYGQAFFLPIILRQNLGYSVRDSQLLGAPQWFYAALLCWIFAWVGDKYRIRGPLLFFNAIQGFIGLPLLGFHPSVGVRYFSTFLIAGGANAAIPTIMAYQANNIRGHWKRAFTSATLVGFGGIGGIAGSLIFRTQDAPHYRPAIFICLGLQTLLVLIVCFNTWWFRRENAKADRGEKILEGDVNFRYTI